MRLMPTSITPEVSVTPTFLKLARTCDIRTIYDCGSRDALDGLFLLEHLGARELHVFECNPAAIQQCQNSLRQFSGPGETYLATEALADKIGQTTFYAIDPANTVTAWTDGNIGASSLFRANPAAPGDRYIQLPIVVNTTSLDEYVRSHTPPDLLWMDLQGAELNVLRGSEVAIRTVTLIHVEVSFRPVYLGQPLFWEVDCLLKSFGFRLHSITNINSLWRRLRIPLHFGVGAWFGDAVYVRDHTA